MAIWALAAPSEYDPQQGMAIGFIIPVALVLGVAVVYAAACALGLRRPESEFGPSVFWPAAGVACIALGGLWYWTSALLVPPLHYALRAKDVRIAELEADAAHSRPPREEPECERGRDEVQPDAVAQAGGSRAGEHDGRKRNREHHLHGADDQACGQREQPTPGSSLLGHTPPFHLA